MLTVLPIVSTDNYTIDLSLEPVVQDFDSWIDYSPAKKPVDLDPLNLYQGIKMPVITARTIQTSLRIFDGETVVMGGVFKDDTKKTNDSIPILGDIPLVGRLFQSEIEDAVKTNLLIFTTVQLIRPDGTPLRPSKYNGTPAFRE
jgi:general secretion pathway protein D